ncbi:MAG TPA: carboxypeptidase M32, partial [Oligoflexia bacterium]|nr:carboxypeptidase M32 [Oligoflexia bacterium]
ARLHEIKPLLLTIADRVRQLFPREDLPVDADASALSGKQFPESRQFDFCRTLLQAIGLPPQSFRLDPTAHPFVRHIGARDIRITSRCQTNNIFAAVFTTLHETGHAIYEFGLPPQHYGTPRGEPASLAIHESQSRLWENFIGRSKPFCSFLFTLLCRDFPAEFANLSADQIWSDVNQVQKSLIRVEADELTYSLHIVIRLLLEEQLVSGTLPVLDLPDAWNALYEHYLRIRPTNNYAGVMQDVHWFQGAVGYFPAYALGNMYAAQLWSALRRENTNIDGQIEQGDFSALIAWLTDNIFVHGKKFTAAELIRRATSKEPSAEDFLQYLEAKFAPQKE